MQDSNIMLFYAFVGFYTCYIGLLYGLSQVYMAMERVVIMRGDM